jgi:diguanylate cyclase (GGDEF)-like protein
MMDHLDVDALPLGVVRLDAAGRIVAANAWFRRWASGGEPVGRQLDEVLVRVPDFLENSTLSTMMACPEDPSRAVLVVRQEAGDGAVLTVMDASDRYEAGRHLRDSRALAGRTRDRLQLIIDTAIAFSSVTSDHRLAELLAHSAARAYRAEESVVYLVGDDGQVSLTAGVDPLAGLLPDSAVLSAAAELQDVIKVSGYLEATQLSPDLADAMRSAGIHAAIAAPIHLDGAEFGFFACYFRHPRAFDEEAAPLAEALAGQAAQKLATARLQRKLEHAAMHDETTNLPNRRKLEELTTTHTVHPLSVIFIDLDGFKDVNDQLGHERGDEVLREVARRLQENIRDSDVVARYGGDEFVVVCQAETDAAAEVAERLRAAIEEPFASLPASLRIGASIGICGTGTGRGLMSVDRLIRGADQAMYAAKGRGGNQVVLANDFLPAVG